LETFLLSFLFILYIVVRYYVTDHDTVIDKDRKRFAEGIALYEAGNFLEAHVYFDQKVKENRKSALAYAYRGKCNRKDGNMYSAMYDFTESLSFDTTIDDVHLEKGMLHYEFEEYNDAFLSFDKAVWFSRGETPEAFRWRALARLKLHQHSQAENDLRKAVSLGDEDAAFVLTQPPFRRRVRLRE
jgi:tetratricopeptide (TPR) repeat protein